jgi:DNA-binding transcriptional ArsR family regulator
VTELVATVAVSQPAVSQHLKVLREARLVRAVKNGRQRIYQLDAAGLEALRRYMEGVWDDALRSYEAEAERLAKEARLRRRRKT